MRLREVKSAPPALPCLAFACVKLTFSTSLNAFESLLGRRGNLGASGLKYTN